MWRLQLSCGQQPRFPFHREDRSTKRNYSWHRECWGQRRDLGAPEPWWQLVLRSGCNSVPLGGYSTNLSEALWAKNFLFGPNYFKLPSINKKGPGAEDSTCIISFIPYSHTIWWAPCLLPLCGWECWDSHTQKTLPKATQLVWWVSLLTPESLLSWWLGQLMYSTPWWMLVSQKGEHILYWPNQTRGKDLYSMAGCFASSVWGTSL